MRRNRFLSVLVHSARVAVVFALLWLLPSPRSDRSIERDGNRAPALTVVQEVLPEAASIDTESGSDGLWTVRDPSGNPVARAARTLPIAHDVIGYRGPTEALIVVDGDSRLLGVRLLESADTEEHVAAVRGAEDFLDQFRGWSWSGPSPEASIDAVSGATLTSLAMAEGVLKRIGGARASLVFPEEIKADELSDWFDSIGRIESNAESTAVFDGAGARLATIVRTGPLVDSIVGYQGPTELLIRLNPQDHRITDIKIRSSFDNQPYVRYCKMEYGFWDLFEGKTVSELASMDLEQAGVEGVSGATMTSLAIAETLVVASQELRRRDEERLRKKQLSERTYWQRLFSSASVGGGLRFAAADVCCLALIVALPFFRRGGVFRKSSVRAMWLLSVLLVFGFWSGNLISMALVAGWSAEGIAWRLAPVLALIAVVAFVSPVLGKSNPYCNHLCPHGALQQLIRPGRSSKRHRVIPKRFATWCVRLPGALLVLAYVTLLFDRSADLSAWEPFHAYLIRIAPWTAILFAGFALVLAAFVPMGYCRYGCPTGSLLDHLRRSAASGKLRWADAVAVGLLVLAVLTHGWG